MHVIEKVLFEEWLCNDDQLIDLENNFFNLMKSFPNLK